jgi:hypothetical protein
MNIPDYTSESLETIFGVKILKFFVSDPDPGFGNLFNPGSGMEKIWIRNPGSISKIRDTGRGSVTVPSLNLLYSTVPW